MELLTVKQVEGQHWSVQENSAVSAAREPVSPAASLLEVTDAGGGSVALRALTNGMYLSARGHDRSLWAMSPAAGNEETFRIERGDDGSARLRANDGSYVVVGDGGIVRAGSSDPAAGTRFVIEDQEALLAALRSQTDCCGREGHHEHAPHAESQQGGGLRVQWNDIQHQRAIRRSVEVLQQFHLDPGIGPWIDSFLKWWRNAGFRGEVERGLREADEKPEFTGTLTVAGINIYYMHFWDPRTNDNFMNWPSKYPENARNQFARRFEESLSPARLWENDQARMKQSAYMFGVALHYLSDITQPMHASNFPNLWTRTIPDPTDWRHSSFEKAADGVDIPVSDPPRENGASDLVFRSTDDLFVWTAKNSNAVWLSTLKKMTDDLYDGPFSPYKEFKTADIVDVVRKTLRPGYRSVAAAMLTFMQRCRDL